jgi:alpha-glucuronidase
MSYKTPAACIAICLLLAISCFGQTPAADDGYRLWLNYDLIRDAAKRQAYTQSAQFIAVSGTSPVLKSAADELQTGLQGLLGKAVPIITNAGSRTGGIVLTTATGPAASSPALTKEGYRITTKNNTITIAGQSDAGVLYGAFALLRQLQTLQPIAAQTGNPMVQLRMCSGPTA